MHIELHTAAREAAALQLRCRRVEDRQPGSGRLALAFDVLPSRKNDVLICFSRFSRVGCHIIAALNYIISYGKLIMVIVQRWKTGVFFFFGRLRLVSKVA